MTAHPYDRPTVPNETCGHREAEHLHGTHACYVLDRCRCLPCLQANRRYERSRSRWLAGVVPSPMVDAEPARQHVRWLIDGGMNMKRIAQIAGVSNATLGKLVYGIPTQGRPPSKRLRRETADKILDCPYDVADGARVHGREARRIVRELLARGWWKAAIARALSDNPDAYALQATSRGKQVTAGTLRALRRLLAEPVPERLHSPTGTYYTPQTDHRWRHVEPSTPGVPAEPETEFTYQGKLRCEVCGTPLATHPMVRCA